MATKRAIDRSVGRWPALVDALVLVALLGLALQLRLANLEHYSGSFDEGIRAEQLLLMERGFRPFHDIFASQGPLLLDLLYPLYVLGGRTLGSARLAVGLLSLAGIVGAWWALRPPSRLAGLGAAAALCLSPGYLDNSRLALAEIPSLAPCVWAVGCAIRWHGRRGAGWLHLAAALAALGVLVKPMAAPIVLPIALLALTRRPVAWSSLAGAVALGVAVVAGVLLLLGPESVYEVLGHYRGGAQQAPGSEATANLSLISKQLLGGERPGLLILAGLGALVALARWPGVGLGLVAWPLAQAAMFALYTDLADKHVVYLVPELALLAGLALWPLTLLAPAGRLTPLARLSGASWPMRVVLAASLAGLAMYGWSLPALWRADQELLRDADEKSRRDYAGTLEQAELMAALVGPDEYVLTDHPLAAYFARRPVPPWLVDTSGTRVDAGSLTSEVAIRESERYRPGVVVTMRRRLGKLEGFNRWLAAQYRLLKSYPGSDPSVPLQLYVRADLEPRARQLLESRRTS
jgi:hypothetical protein